MDTLIMNEHDKDIQQLARQDPVMGKLIRYVGTFEVPLRTDYFASLVRSITGQQISVAAASSIYERLKSLTDNKLDEKHLSALSDEQLREIGFSRQKVLYIRDLIEHVNENKVDLDRITELDNKTVMDQLTSVKGIGKWTAEMFLIFSLTRMNVLAVDDIGIQRGARWLYNVDKAERKNILKQKKSVWSPHLTIASCYLWEVVHLDLERRFTTIDDIQ